jgi:MscS family membrane protein
LVGLGIGGIAIAFAAQQTIADVFGGVSIFTSKPFVVGDRIEFDTTVGVVEQVGLRYTRVRTNDQQLLTVPNAKLSGSIITNLENTVKRRIELRLGVTYDTSVKKLEAAKQTISRILSENELVEKDPVPLVVFRDFKDSSLELFVLYFVQTPDWRIAQETRDRINFQVKSEFEKQKIEFAYPTSTVYLKK